MGGRKAAQDVEIQVDGSESIRGIFLSGEQVGGPCVIFAHGLGSDRSGEKAAALLAECDRRGWAYAAFDFRGHGASDGSMLELRGSGLLRDLEAIRGFAAARGFPRVAPVGSSMGGWAAAWDAALHPEEVLAVVTVAPAFRILEWRSLGREERGEWERTGRHRLRTAFIDLEIGWSLPAEAPRFPAEDLAARLVSPLLIFHGMKDDVVPFEESVEFARACAAPEVELRLFKEGDHRLNTIKEEIARGACDFIAAHNGDS